jgi:hypothetical protein
MAQVLARITYTRHLRTRLEMRKFPLDLPRKIFEKADRRYRDRETDHLIAVKLVRLRRQERLVMIAYDQKGEGVEIVTIHPISKEQETSRGKRGRWNRIG